MTGKVLVPVTFLKKEHTDHMMSDGLLLSVVFCLGANHGSCLRCLEIRILPRRLNVIRLTEVHQILQHLHT